MTYTSTAIIRKEGKWFVARSLELGVTSQGKTIEEDLDRRDFTINALAVPLKSWSLPGWRKNLIDRHLTDEEDLIVPVILRDGPGGLG